MSTCWQVVCRGPPTPNGAKLSTLNIVTQEKRREKKQTLEPTERERERKAIQDENLTGRLFVYTTSLDGFYSLFPPHNRAAESMQLEFGNFPSDIFFLTYTFIYIKIITFLFQVWRLFHLQRAAFFAFRYKMILYIYFPLMSISGMFYLRPE